MEIRHSYYVSKALGKVYVLTVAIQTIGSKVHVGIAYQGKKDGYDKKTGDDLAVKRLNENPLVLYENDKHFNLGSAILLYLPSHMRSCMRTFNRAQYLAYRQTVKALESAVSKIHNI